MIVRRVTLRGFMKTAVYTCPFVPAEWIAAHGVRPKRIMPLSAENKPSVESMAGTCAYARTFMHAVCIDKEADAVIVTTLCDQMRRAPDWIARDFRGPLFLMNVPSTWETETARQLYVDELRRLGGFLTQLGGVTPSDGSLSQVMRRYDSARMDLRASRTHQTARQYSEAIAAFNLNGLFEMERSGSLRDSRDRELPHRGPQRGGRIAILGGPLRKSDFGIFDLIGNTGGDVVLDATESGERTLPARFDGERLQQDPLAELAHAYFGTIADISRRPNSILYKWLDRKIAERSVQGIILWRYVWCDLWHAEVECLRERTGLPILNLDVDGTPGTFTNPRVTTRIQAFLDTAT